MKQNLFRMFLILSCLCAVPCGAQSITNGDFEGGTLTGWSYMGAWSIASGVNHTPGGLFSATNLEILGGHDDYIYQTVSGINAGETWECIAWIRGAPSPGTSYFGWYDGSGNPIDNVQVIDLGSFAEWSVSHTFTPAEVASGIQVRYQWVNATGSMYIDDVSIQLAIAVDTPTPEPTSTPSPTPDIPPPASDVDIWEVYR